MVSAKGHATNRFFLSSRGGERVGGLWSSMEHVRLIITADEVIYPELTHNPLASHFTGHLAVALKEAAEQAHQMEVLQEEMSDVSDGAHPDCTGYFDGISALQALMLRFAHSLSAWSIVSGLGGGGCGLTSPALAAPAIQRVSHSAHQTTPHHTTHTDTRFSLAYLIITLTPLLPFLSPLPLTHT